MAANSSSQATEMGWLVCVHGEQTSLGKLAYFRPVSC